MINFTNDEINLMCIYNTDSKSGLVNELTAMKACLSSEEPQLLSMTDTVLEKLKQITEEEFAELELYPDFPKEGR